jgi:hypothetical protein
LLGFHGRARPEVKAKLRAIADQVIKEIVARLTACGESRAEPVVEGVPSVL